MPNQAVGDHFRFGRYELQPAQRRLLLDGAPVAVGPRPFDVLVVLVERAGSLVTKDELLRQVWPRVVVEENTLQAQVSALRRVLGAAAIATVPGWGYRFEPEVRHLAASPPLNPGVATDNLPVPPTGLVGRGPEIGDVIELLQRGRLLTLVGAGGCGKTRLALQAAREALGLYADGVWFVDLAPLADPELIANALARVFDLRAEANQSAEDAVVDHLASRRLLLLVDNAEHLLEAAGHLVDSVLRRCTGVAFLVTSRERLACPAELTYRVPSLSVPDASAGRTAEQIGAFEGARLFAERARSQCPGFTVTNDNAAAIASVCRRLDGMPLAIELAASHVRAMTVAEIDRRIGQRFALLSGSTRGRVPRQRTLRAAIDWSYDLLNGDEQALLCRLSVFAGGWTLGAAEAVCGGEAVDGQSTLDLLSALTDKSLVLVDGARSVTRFSMLQTVREYARDRLPEHGDPARWQERHLDHFLPFLQAEAAKLRTANADAMERLRAELDNLRAALATCCLPGHVATGLRFGASMYKFWWWRGEMSEGLAALRRLLEPESAPVDRPMRIHVLYAAGIFAGYQADHGTATAFYEQGLALARALGDSLEIARLSNVLGMSRVQQGDLVAARTLLEEGLAVGRELGDVGVIRQALDSLAMLAAEVGDDAGASGYFEESLAGYRADNDRFRIAVALNNLSNMAYRQGDFAAARRRCEESLAIHREVGEPRGIATALAQLGLVLCAQDEQRRGRALQQESLAVLVRLGDRYNAVQIIEGLAEVVSTTQPGDAACLWGGAQRVREESRLPSAPRAAASLAVRVAQARALVGDDLVFERNWQAGRSMALPQLVEFALAL